MNTFNKVSGSVVKSIVSGVLALVLASAVFANDLPFGERSIFSDRAVKERVKASGSVCVEGQDCGTAAAEEEAVAASPEDVYQSKCFACHGTGAAGAPKVGDAAVWTARLANGLDTVVANAINGVGGMPPKGTCMDCSDDTIKAVVEYMVEASK